MVKNLDRWTWRVSKASCEPPPWPCWRFLAQKGRGKRWGFFRKNAGFSWIFMGKRWNKGVFLTISDGTLWKFVCFFEDFWWETRWFNDFEWWFNGGHTSYCKLNRRGTPNQEWAILDDPKKYLVCPNFKIVWNLGGCKELRTPNILLHFEAANPRFGFAWE